MEWIKWAPSRVTILAYLQSTLSYPIQAFEMEWALKSPFILKKLAVEQYIAILDSYLSNKWWVNLAASPISEDLTWPGISILFTWMKGSNESSPMNSYKEPCRRDKFRRCCVSILREAFTSLITAMPDFTSKLSSLHKYNPFTMTITAQ